MAAAIDHMGLSVSDFAAAKRFYAAAARQAHWRRLRAPD
jgi:hypothetical protein